MDRETLIVNSDLSVRVKNLLLSHAQEFGITRPLNNGLKENFALKHLEHFDIRIMRRLRGIGQRTLKEVILVCDYAGIKLIGWEKNEPDSNYKIITISLRTKSGRELYDFARLLQTQDKHISISNIEQQR